MLFLIFHLGEDWYALKSAEIVQVLPHVAWKVIPQAPPGVAGVINYHGTPVPLIDPKALSLGQAAARHMSTRIILFNYLASDGETHLLGLLAEQTTETIRREINDFVDAGVPADRAPYLGPVTNDERGLIQLIEPRKLLSPALCELLFREQIETCASNHYASEEA